MFNAQNHSMPFLLRRPVVLLAWAGSFVDGAMADSNSATGTSPKIKPIDDVCDAFRSIE